MRRSAAALSADEDLVAVWRTSDGQRFQNYRAKFAVLDLPFVPHAWLHDVLAVSPLPAARCPLPASAPPFYGRWVQQRRRSGRAPSRADP